MPTQWGQSLSLRCLGREDIDRVSALSSFAVSTLTPVHFLVAFNFGRILNILRKVARIV